MKIRNIIHTGCVMLACVMFSCKEEIIETPVPAPSEEKITLKIEGSTSSGEEKGSRAYMGENKGVYWMAGDSISLITENLDKYGMSLEFITDEKSEGKKEATFFYNGYLLDYIDTYFPKGGSFVACYPKMSVKARSTFTTVRSSTIPRTHKQDGNNSRHLKNTMIMLSGKITLEEGLSPVNGVATLPKITFTHRSVVHRFLVTNRKAFPLKLKSVNMKAYKANTDQTAQIFDEDVTFHLETMNVTKRGSKPYNFREVEITNGDVPYYELEPGESVYLYASSFNANVGNVDFIFSVTDADGVTYNTLALPGSRIQNSAFEFGKCYTYKLLVDNNLTLQDLEDDYIDNVNLGQRTFTLSSDNIVLPLSGERRATVAINTSDERGWLINNMPDWCSATTNSGPTGESTITFAVQKSDMERKGVICITSGNLNKYINIRQSDNANTTDEVYLTMSDMEEKNIISYILQDNESTDTLYNKNLRSFSTLQPLQHKITDNNKINLRFYSPRKLTDVQVWASIPSLIDEEILIAQLEEIPGFADIYADFPDFGSKDCKFKTISGKEITIKRNQAFPVNRFKLRITSSCPYWEMLQDIKVEWRVSFRGIHNHHYVDPNKYMRGAHCREAVALALNNTYMFSTKEYRDYLYSLQGKLYTDNEGKNFVNTRDFYYNRVCKSYPFEFGLTKIAGFAWPNGGGFYILEDAYLTHYADDIAADNLYVIWHEMGHVFGYTHDGNITFENGLGIGWSKNTAVFYHHMSKAKKLPIYSRRFMHNRDKEGSSLYGNKHKVTEWHSFGTTEEDDAELYAIDQGRLWYFDK